MTFDPDWTTCKLAGCDARIRRGAIVCQDHDAHRCPEIVDKASTYIETRRCRNTTTPGEKCWRHRKKEGACPV
jgi:hypothetical protein